MSDLLAPDSVSAAAIESARNCVRRIRDQRAKLNNHEKKVNLVKRQLEIEQAGYDLVAKHLAAFGQERDELELAYRTLTGKEMEPPNYGY